MKVYAGIDPVTKKRYYLDDVVPAGPKAAAEAEKLRTKFLNQVDEKRSSRTHATVTQLLERVRVLRAYGTAISVPCPE